MKKTLVAYFSASGTTKKLAENLAKAADADLFEIKAAKPYTPADLNWMDKSSRSSVEMKDPSSRPEIANKIENFGDYDTVFVGFPIWWYVAPTIINTFLESYDFSGKTVIPFATSGGSSIDEAEETLKKCCSSETKWKHGKRLENFEEDALKNWVNSLSI